MFFEGHGASIIVLMPVYAAITCNAPLYGIVAINEVASDKQGRSVPAPFAKASAYFPKHHPLLLEVFLQKPSTLTTFDEYVQFLDFSRANHVSAVTDSDTHILAQIIVEYNAAIHHVRAM
ncbi:hypothetical protein EV175_003915 [Coemansia sp. RSA 1933]|nr:hypothetical protein EV175_003915 [Coemansia sp. RSA 1933]